MANGKLTVQDWAEGLSRRSRISRAKSDNFLRAFFNLIKKGLTEDNFVKIKGLGTFKLVSVSSRESIDVNTGQRIEIGEHQRLLFTPDKTMKERVNRPFEQFETMVIEDDSLNIEAIDRLIAGSKEEQDESFYIKTEQTEKVAETKDSPKTENYKKHAESNVTSKKIPTATKQIKEDHSAKPRLEIQSLSLTGQTVEKKIIDPRHSKLLNASKSSADEESLTSNPSQIQESEETNTSRSHRLISALLIIAGFIIIAVSSYLIGYFHIFEKQETKAEATLSKTFVVPAPTKQVSQHKKSESTVKHDSASKQRDIMELSKNFKQLPGGKFLIIGTLTTHRMKVGDNLLLLSRKILGSKDYVDYIIFHNGLKNPDVVPLGSDIKIPLLANYPNSEIESN